MKRTVVVERVLNDSDGMPLASRRFDLRPSSGDKEFSFASREVRSDAEGRIRVDGVVPGLSYHIEEIDPPAADGLLKGPNGMIAYKGTRMPWFDEVMILAPVDKSLNLSPMLRDVRPPGF